LFRRDAKRAVAAYRRAIELGCVEALLNLGICYANGRGVPRSQERELSCYTALWRIRRDPAAAANAACVFRDRGDVRTAFRWWRRAADITVFDQEAARYHLAVAHLDRGRSADRQRARAVPARANRDDDYPEPEALPGQLKTGGDVRPCRCVRGLARKANGQAPCLVHRRPAAGRSHPATPPAIQKRRS
jgi:TPR repeat protein